MRPLLHWLRIERNIQVMLRYVEVDSWYAPWQPHEQLSILLEEIVELRLPLLRKDCSDQDSSIKSGFV